MVPAPSLHGRYPLPRYYEPVRLPAAAARRLCLSAERWTRRPSARAGSPRFLGRSFPTRCPQPPRKAWRLLSPVASPSVAGFISFGRLATFNVRNEAESGSLALRLAGLPPEASPDGLLRRTLGWLSVERATDRVTSFHVTRTTRLCLALQSTPRTPRHFLHGGRDEGE